MKEGSWRATLRSSPLMDQSVLDPADDLPPDIGPRLISGASHPGMAWRLLSLKAVVICGCPDSIMREDMVDGKGEPRGQPQFEAQFNLNFKFILKVALYLGVLCYTVPWCLVNLNSTRSRTPSRTMSVKKRCVLSYMLEVL